MPTNRELEKRLNGLEAKVDALMVAAQVMAKPSPGAEPWSLEKFPEDWLKTGTNWVTVKAKAEDYVTFNGVRIPLVKGVPWEVPMNIAHDLREKGWA